MLYIWELSNKFDLNQTTRVLHNLQNHFWVKLGGGILRNFVWTFYANSIVCGTLLWLIKFFVIVLCVFCLKTMLLCLRLFYSTGNIVVFSITTPSITTSSITILSMKIGAECYYAKCCAKVIILSVVRLCVAAPLTKNNLMLFLFSHLFQRYKIV